MELVTTASFHPPVVIEPRSSTRPVVKPGQVGLLEYTITTYSTPSQPPPSLETASIRCDLPFRWVSDLEESKMDGGLTQRSRRLAVTLPPTETVGTRGQWLEFFDDAIGLASQRIQWEIVPVVTVKPSGFYLSLATQESMERTSLVTAEDGRVFRLTSAKCDQPGLSAEFDEDPAVRHAVKFRINTSQITEGSFLVQLATDHPDQPVIVVSFLSRR